MSAVERKYLLELARRTLASVTGSGSVAETTESDVSPKLAEKKACFVTLTKDGTLRGCIGHLTAVEPLHRAVVDNARKMIGKTIDIAVTSVLQTTAGKMIFGKFDERATYRAENTRPIKPGAPQPSQPSSASAAPALANDRPEGQRA